MKIITLTTDFGTRDGFVGTMKGVIWGISPDVQIADISHEITPHNILEGAYALWRAAPFFPDGTVHVAVIDPGVGTKRRPIAIKTGKQYLVGPDNGVFTPFLAESYSSQRNTVIVHLDKPQYWLPKVSRTFHGRDIFAPAAAHLLQGIPLNELGSPITDPCLLHLPQPEKTQEGWIAHITIIDVFGNLTTDLHSSQIENQPTIFRLHGKTIDQVVTSYGHRQKGEFVALIDSEDYIEIAQVNGSAAKALGAKVGDIVEVIHLRT
jgi:S-adenosylmethionine hydrolase